MGLSRMSPEKLARAKGASRSAGHLADLARAATGGGVTAAERRRAAAELEKAVGKRRAARLTEDALVQAGAKPKGLRRWLG